MKDIKKQENGKELEEKENIEEKINDEGELNEFNEKYDELNDKYLRCLAEYDNFRKRTSKEKERIFSDAVAYSVKGMLEILDNFERALKCETKDLEMKKGFEMIFTQFLDMLKNLGVEEIKVDDKNFDPSFHNAVMHIEDKNYGKNEIVEILQKGYKIGDNVIRYAMVKVAN